MLETLRRSRTWSRGQYQPRERPARARPIPPRVDECRRPWWAGTGTATTCESAQAFRGISLSQKSIPLCDHTRCLAGAFDNLLWAVPAMTMTLTRINRNSVSLAGEFAALSQLALRGYDANMTLGRTKSVDILVSNPATLPSGAMAARNRARRIPHYARSNPRLARLRTINTPPQAVTAKKQCPGHVVSPKR